MHPLLIITFAISLTKYYTYYDETYKNDCPSRGSANRSIGL